MVIQRPPTTHEIEAILAVLDGRRWSALTGAGVSTDSGIPDYRGPDSPKASPITFQDFVKKPHARTRYWARSQMGYRSFGIAHPNRGHFALAALGVPIITQNVDGLHTEAGSRAVIPLHGLISRVICLDCGDLTSRASLQDRLDHLNPHVQGAIPAGTAELRPDGDADIDETEGFTVPPCEVCGGMLKPDVVFFGETVPKPRVDACYQLIDDSDAVVVAGSSLTVMSGLRFARHASKQGKPIVIINAGPTRADDIADLRTDAGTSETLTALAARLPVH